MSVAEVELAHSPAVSALVVGGGEKSLKEGKGERSSKEIGEKPKHNSMRVLILLPLPPMYVSRYCV